MLFSTLFTIVSFLPKFITSSPMYNVPPDRLITNIGSFARNIRNIPCISRRSSEKGVCMFAIDCQKSNGTHLGTCIDRFYFGSCCRIDPHDIIGNTIDAALIPSRQPPSRISSTISTPFAQDIDKTTIHLQLSTLQNKIFSTLSTSGPADEIIKNITTIIKPSFNFGDKLTSQSIPTTPSTITTKANVSKFTPTSKPSTEANATEISYKLTTFQTVEENTITAEPLTTQKLLFNYTRTRPTLRTKPPTLTTLNTFSTNSKTKSTTSRPTLRPRPTVTRKPTKTFKPSIRPVTTTAKVTTKKSPSVASTLRFTNTKTTKKPTTTESATTKKYVTEKITTQKFTTDFTTKQSTNALKSSSALPSSTATPENLPSITPTLGTPTTEKNISGLVVENEDTNEIEQPKPLQPPPTTEQPNDSPFVTWEVINEESTIKPIISTENSMPISASNEWVLVPNLTTSQPNISAITISPIKDTTYLETTPGKPVESFTSSTNVPFNYATENSSTVNSSATISVTTSPNVSSTYSQEELLSSTTTKPGVNMTDFTDVCGRRLYPEARIVGGERAAYGKWPWQISLRQWRTSTYLHKCGAALLNENWAITAAHCVDNVPPSDLLLRLGEHDLSTDNEPYIHQERRVQIVASHPQFDPRTFEYDLALLRFYEPVQFQPNIIPVCVPNNDENFVGRTAHVTGWGRLYEDGPLPSVLQEVSVPVINNTVCESMYRSAGYIEHIPHIFICAGWRRGGFDSCEGDSGGPMVIQRPDKRFLLAGVISWGIGCAEPNQPGVYTRISEFRDWINQILQF